MFFAFAFAFAAQPLQHPQFATRVHSYLTGLKFSPNGRYVLAQDDFGITVLSVQPFAVLFRIPARDAEHAGFTADSKEVVFVNAASTLKADDFQASVLDKACLERW